MFDTISRIIYTVRKRVLHGSPEKQRGNKMFEFLDGSCYPKALVGVYAGLACVDGFLAAISFFQLLRVHSRNTDLGWTRQKVFHLLIGSSNLGYLLYFVTTLVAACKGWVCWSNSCGFIVMACPKILFLSAYLLLLSFWVDLCHQPNDDDDDDEGYSPREALLEKTNKVNADVRRGRRCCSFRGFHMSRRQKIVILVTMLISLVMAISAVLIWIGRGENPIDSPTVARVYVDLFALAVILVGGALACYGTVLFIKMSKVRSERVSSEKWKVAGLAAVSLLCFSSSSLVAIFTDVPLIYQWDEQEIDGLVASFLVVLYYFLGSSVPSAFVLWVMREMPPPLVTNRDEESRTLAFVSDGLNLNAGHPQCWAAVATSQNQATRSSPI